jgi:DNA-binding NtrC family response regulator
MARHRFTVFIVDKDAALRTQFRKALKRLYRARDFGTAEEAILAMSDRPADLVLVEVGLPGMNGLEALRRIKGHWPETLVIMMTASEDVQTVIAAMKQGAHDYLLKPIHVDSLLARVHDALQTIRLGHEVHVLQERFIRESVPCVLGESRVMHEVMELVTMVAQSPDTPVLICGETGTGKELIASAIHHRSPNAHGPFVPVNCAGIPAHLTESEFFGYEPGSFTGARASGKKGLVEEAENGTLFLDEVGDLGPDAQAKLLRFLESGEFYHVGGTRRLMAHTRIISATNQDLAQLARQGKFRDDLYYRLSVIKIEVPSLKARKADILPLADHFRRLFCQKFRKTVETFSPEAEQALLNKAWQGNIRELRNLVERAVLLAKGNEVGLDALGLVVGPPSTITDGEAFPPAGVDLTTVLDAVEKRYLDWALERSQGNEAKAAGLLKMNYHTFRYRRKRLEKLEAPPAA